jgi:hypothetical protein
MTNHLSHGRTRSKDDRFTYTERTEIYTFLCSKLSEEREKIVERPQLYTCSDALSSKHIKNFNYFPRDKFRLKLLVYLRKPDRVKLENKWQ